ncbi:hypothetical protein HMPREF9607_02077 [Cutibacterium modestum HL044PA1]|uniref:Uncharacterized protein n=1 Tax=Cutibacterium modestum HL044PA1 TaxID=765109 RepID=A0ABP2K7J3_9ACTN|nr:hypothetical protein HMPREF9607_02077 [Cutibacterium modestum HL044PA1]
MARLIWGSDRCGLSCQRARSEDHVLERGPSVSAASQSPRWCPGVICADEVVD